MKNKKWFFYASLLLLTGFGIFALTSFDKQSLNKGNQSEVKVTTKNVANITTTSADCNFTVEMTGNTKVKIISAGVRLVKQGSVGGPSIAGKGTGINYVSKLTGLTPATKYSVSAYVITSTGTVSGGSISFGTRAQ